MTPKELKKLAASCRAAGILHYKQGDVEFTLSPTAPAKIDKKDKKSNESVQGEVESEGWESLSEEEKMFYSVGGIPLSIGS